MPELILPTTRLRAGFAACRADWGPGLHEDGFGIGADDDVDSPAGFAAWVARRTAYVHEAGTPCPPQQHGSPRWIVEGEQVLGAIALRHRPDDEVGQVGYGVRPSARGRGLATWALGQILLEARAALGQDRVLAVCLADNAASVRTLEANGGVLETHHGGAHGRVGRYWLPVPA